MPEANADIAQGPMISFGKQRLEHHAFHVCDFLFVGNLHNRSSSCVLCAPFIWNSQILTHSFFPGQRNDLKTKCPAVRNGCTPAPADPVCGFASGWPAHRNTAQRLQPSPRCMTAPTPEAQPPNHTHTHTHYK